MLQSVLSQLAAMFMMVGTGYLVAKKGIVSERFQSDLAELVLWVALPCSIVESGTLDSGPDALNSILWMTALSVASYALVILATELFNRRMCLKGSRNGVFKCLIVFANTAFVGYPVCSLLLGSKGVFYASFFNMIFSLFFFTYGVKRISGRVGGFRILFTQDPGMAATVVMLILFAAQWKPPELIRTFLSTVGATCTPLSMFVVGCMLTRVNVRQLLREKSYYALAAFRLLAVPLFALLVMLPLVKLGVDKDIIFAVIIMCAMPAGSLTAIYSEKYGADASYASGGIVHTMICFALSLPMVILTAKWALYGGA